MAIAIYVPLWHCDCMARHTNTTPDNPLARYKREKSLTDDQLGDWLGLDRTHVSRLRRGKRGPSLETALRIQERSGGAIPVEAWGHVAA